MATARRISRARPAAPASTVIKVDVGALTPDQTNPRKADPARTGLLRLSLAKLGFIMPLYVDEASGLLLSGHQRLGAAKDLKIAAAPVIRVNLRPEDIKGVNILFNRCTNDFTAFDTGGKAQGKLDLDTVIAAAEELPDFEGDDFFAYDCKSEPLEPLVRGAADRYDKKAATIATSLLRMGIKIPIVASESGRVVNGIHRAFSALESGVRDWPVIRIPDQYAEVALNFLNYLSMDFHVDDEFKRKIRYSAYRRPQNNRGAVPKSYRFWANDERTLQDKDSYSPEYWVKFKDIHGTTLLDFGAGLCKVAPYLVTHGFDAYDFEPYRIDPESEVGKPNPLYSKMMARQFLHAIANPRLKFDSIFMSSVLNSIPFPDDRLCVLAIVHALCTKSTVIYGTCRDMSDFNYEYGGIRNANYFTWDTEPGVRVGDVMRAPKLQKFETVKSAEAMFKRFWREYDFWPGGNIFYWRVKSPMGFNPKILSAALELEFNLPYEDGTTMDLVDEAKAAFSKRLSVTLK